MTFLCYFIMTLSISWTPQITAFPTDFLDFNQLSGVDISPIQSLSRTVVMLSFPSLLLPDARPLCIIDRTRLYG